MSKSLDSSSSSVSDSKKPLVTQRELEILQKISDGLSDGEIAESLFISQHTARKHRQNLIDKLGVNNSAELIKVAVQIGLV